MKTNSLDFDAQALREKILDLAMRGKLVPQDPNDEPASVLLDKIKTKKAELIKEKKIKKTKSLPPITDEEKPFDIPDSWEWVRLGDIGTVATGNTPSKRNLEFYGGNIPFVKPADIQIQEINYNTEEYLSNIGEKKGRIAYKDDILITCIGNLGRNNVINKKVAYNQQINSISPIIVNSELIHYFMSSNFFVSSMYKWASATTLPILNKTKLSRLIIPLPSLTEQKRIIVKIAQLFALLRKVETSTQQYAKLQTLLKSKVLDLAMRGKLVKQDPNDEPASELLKKIKAEKAKLIKEKKIKKSKPLPPITDDEKPFDIPDSWEWVRLGDLVAPVEYAMADGPFGSNLKKADYTNQPEVRIVQLSNIGENGWKDDNVKYTTFDHLKLIRRSEVFPGNIVIAKMMPAGRAILIPNKDKKYVLSSDAVKFIPSDLLNKQFLLNAINSNVYRDQVNKKLQGTTRPRTSLKKLKNFVLPIPPIQEQKRILSKLSMLKQDLI
ncbi:restriction endonuclease subunit S [Lactobacillus amylovorus]|uniref:restriction endonuclease subunit S n=1 Tax=Lactobacillus amylovorus TaxID=1604 RepID=UPI00232AFBED|nr:restriction endonuclease subunit S [Lactobacillus amylovorus]MDB6251208.1 restriction endonuclease subunit S [Lactobacillus amylovorus]